MQEYVEQVAEALSQSPFGSRPHVLKAWRTIKLQPLASSPEVAQASWTNNFTINVGSSFNAAQPQQQQTALLSEFGILLFRRADESCGAIWDKKFCLPEKPQLDAVQNKLASQELAKFRDLVESFTSAMDRLVALNVCNALLANGMSREQARNVNIFQWGSTADYACLRRTHSIKPLVCAYADRAIVESPGAALAELVVNKMQRVSEQSVGKAYGNLITELFSKLAY